MRAVLFALLLTACGRVDFGVTPGASDSATDAIPAVTLRFTPRITTQLPQTAVQFSAQVSGTADTRVVWSLDEADRGTISADGIYTAPVQTGAVHVRATSVADPTQSVVATIEVALPGAPVALANTGSVSNATGMAHQTHLIYAPDFGEWWLWYVASNNDNELLTSHSTDFVTWTAGARADITDAHANDGRNLSVADKVLNGQHVVHLSLGLPSGRGFAHLQASLGQGTITFATTQPLSTNGNVDPDGPAVVITDAGTVVHATGWDATPETPPLFPCGNGDNEIFTSTINDNGTTNLLAANFRRDVLWCVPTTINARYMAAVGEQIYLLYDDGGNNPRPVNLFFNQRRSDGTWLPDQTTRTVPPSVFGNDNDFDLNDWGASVQGGNLHAMRRVPAGYEHRLFTVGTEGAWRDGAAVPILAGKPGSGIYLTPYGTGVLAVQIAASAANEVEYSFFNGVMWSPWRALVTTAATRNFIAGSAPLVDSANGAGPAARPAIMWTESGLVFRIIGLQLP
jgi:hypothetical protein